MKEKEFLALEADWREKEYQGVISTSSNVNRKRKIVLNNPISGSLLTNVPVTKEGQVKYSCTACGKVYQHRQSLYNHVSYQCGREPQFACPYCQYRSRHKVNLKRHIATIHMVGLREQLGDLINAQASLSKK